MLRVDSSKVERSGPPDDGGSIPTSTLQIRKTEWIVERADASIADQMVAEHHYAKGSSNTDTYLHGLFPRDWHWHAQCVGVARWIPPTKAAGIAWAGEDWRGVLSLSRLVIKPGVPKNACSFLLSKSVRLIDAKEWRTLVTYADTWRGHDGTIYRAAGWEYCGETKPEAVYTLNGRMIARKAGPTTRTHSEMIAMGCVFEGRFAKNRFCLRRGV